MINMVFFEPQTGLIKRHCWKSNFHIYRLRNSRSPVASDYTIPWLEANIEKATLGANGLEYSNEFWETLNIMEQEADKAIHRLAAVCKRNGESIENIVPRKQNGELY